MGRAARGGGSAAGEAPAQLAEELVISEGSQRVRAGWRAGRQLAGPKCLQAGGGAGIVQDQVPIPAVVDLQPVLQDVRFLPVVAGDRLSQAIEDAGPVPRVQEVVEGVGLSRLVPLLVLPQLAPVHPAGHAAFLLPRPGWPPRLLPRRREGGPT